MKKLLLSLFAVLAVLAPSVVHADATYTSTTNARSVSTAQGISESVAIADPALGYAARVDSRGSVSTQEHPGTITVTAGIDALLVTGAARVTEITLAGGNTAAGDYVNIYDALSATGTPKLEIAVGTAKDSKSIVIPGGAQFTTGVYADLQGTAGGLNSIVSVVYDQ